MGLFDQPYDPRGGERSQDFGEPVPRGKYRLEITASEDRANKSGQGRHLWIENTIRGGSYAGRKIFHRFNLQNQSQKAQEIGTKEFNSLLDAIGMGQTPVRSAAQLLGKVYAGRVDVESNGDRMDNVIKGFDPAGEAAADSQPPAGQPAWQKPAGAPAAPPPAPWAAKPSAAAAQPPAQAQEPAQQAPAAAPAAEAAQPAAQPAAEPARPPRPWERRAAA